MAEGFVMGSIQLRREHLELLLEAVAGRLKDLPPHLWVPGG
jgi:hypothetical protein